MYINRVCALVYETGCTVKANYCVVSSEYSTLIGKADISKRFLSTEVV